VPLNVTNPLFFSLIVNEVDSFSCSGKSFVEIVLVQLILNMCKQVLMIGICIFELNEQNR